MRDFIDRTGADELIVVSHIYDHAARLRSYEIAAQVASVLGTGDSTSGRFGAPLRPPAPGT